MQRRNKMTGTKRINKVIGRFATLVMDLEHGVEEVQSEITSNQDLICILKGENTDLGKTKVVGINLVRGITKLVNGE